MSTIIFLSGRSANDALGAAGRAHRVLYEALGHEFVEVNFATPGSQDLLNQTLQRPVEFAFAAMGMGADLKGTTSEGREVNLWQGMRIPYLSLNGDTPAYYFDRHGTPTPWHACLYFYPEHLEFRKRLPMTPGLYGIVPTVPFDSVDKREVDFRKKESGKLLFLKNGNDPEKLVRSWRDAMPAATFLALADLAGALAGGINGTIGDDIDALVTSYFLDHGWDLGEFLNLRLFFVAQLDDYLRRVKSAMVADTIADFPVEIHGLNWEHVNFSGRRATYVPGGDYTQSRTRILESLGVIDMSPNTQRAPHDRPMRAFGLYTFCLTNQQRYFTENFSNAGKFCYRFDKDDLQARIADALTHPKRHVELGVDVAEQFLRGRRPEMLAQFLLETAGHIRLASGPRPGGLQDYFGWPPST
jgi:hypothetical protein